MAKTASPPTPKHDETGVGRMGLAKPHMRVKADIPLPETASMSNGDDLSIRDAKDRVEALFKSIGTETLPDTLFPTGSRNNGPQAAEFAMADLLEKLAKQRKKEAFEEAQKAGVFGDDASLVPNETVVVWNSPALVISIKTGKPTKMVNREQLEDALVRHLGKKAPEVLEECMKERAATKQIIVAMK